MITQDSFLYKIHYSDISKVYYGKDRCCRCGCGGNYTYTTLSNEKQTYYKTDDVSVIKMLMKAKGLILRGAKADYGEKYVNLVVEADVALTFYFN